MDCSSPTGCFQSCNGVVNSLAPIGGSVQLELIVDRKTIEIFGNNGQLYMSWPANNPAGTSRLSLTCSGGTATFNSLTVHKLKSIWTGSSKCWFIRQLNGE